MLSSFSVPSGRRVLVLVLGALLALGAAVLLAFGGSSGGPAGASAAPPVSSAQAGGDKYFLEIPGINGGSTNAKHANTIEPISWSLGVENSATIGGATGGATAGKATAKPFTFAHAPNPSWPTLFQAAATGKHYPQAKLFVSRTTQNQQVDYLVYTMKDVLVSETGDSVSSGGSPRQRVTLAYAALSVEFRSQKADGTFGSPVKGGFDFKQNKVSP